MGLKEITTNWPSPCLSCNDRAEEVSGGGSKVETDTLAQTRGETDILFMCSLYCEGWILGDSRWQAWILLG